MTHDSSTRFNNVEVRTASSAPAFRASSTTKTDRSHRAVLPNGTVNGLGADSTDVNFALLQAGEAVALPASTLGQTQYGLSFMAALEASDADRVCAVLMAHMAATWERVKNVVRTLAAIVWQRLEFRSQTARSRLSAPQPPQKSSIVGIMNWLH
jgi:hypothetical protein